MNRNDFINLIEDIVPVNRQMISEVYELIDIFPYFQSAHMILIKGLQNTADVKFENQLRSSAIHIADREMLYYFLKTKTSPEIEHIVSNRDNTSSEFIGNDTQQTVIESAKNSEYLISDIEKNSGETISKEQQDTLNQTSGHTILISSESDNEESAGVMFLLDEESSLYEDKVYYMDPGFSVPEKSDLLELDLTDNKPSISDEFAFSQEHPDYEWMNSKKQLQSELIDKFIITNPRIETNREKTNLNVEDITKSFVEEGGGFVTETLARIYINQGYYSKAIDIYEILCLKFPEKNSYFASQIEKVREYIKK